MFKPFKFMIFISSILNLNQTNELHVSNSNQNFNDNSNLLEQITNEETTVGLDEYLESNITVANISFEQNSTSESFTDLSTFLYTENITTSIASHETPNTTESTDTTSFESIWPETTPTTSITITTKTTSTRDTRYCQEGYIGKYCDGRLFFI